MLTAAQLLSASKTADQILSALYTYATENGAKVKSWQKAGPTRTILYALSRVAKPFSNSIESLANSSFLHTAKRGFLTLVAREIYAVKRTPATYATKIIQVGNSGGGYYVYKDRQCRFLNPTRKATYVNVGQFVINPLSAPINVPIIAEKPGSASIALAGEVSAFETPRDGLYIVDTLVALANNEEDDDSLIARCEAKIGYVPLNSQVTAPGGARSSYESIAKSGPKGETGVIRPNGSVISVTRVFVSRAPDGYVTVFVADEDGPLIDPDLALVDAAIVAYATSIGQNAGALNPSSLTINISGVITVPDDVGLSDDEIIAEATAAAALHVQRTNIGGAIIAPLTRVFRRDALITSIGKGLSFVGAGVDLSTPAGNLSIAVSQVPVVGTISFVVQRVEGE